MSAGDSFATFLVAMNEMTTEAATIKRQIIMYSMLNPPFHAGMVYEVSKNGNMKYGIVAGPMIIPRTAPKNGM